MAFGAACLGILVLAAVLTVGGWNVIDFFSRHFTSKKGNKNETA